MSNLIVDLNGWEIMDDSKFEIVPDRPFLVYLAEPVCCTHVHVAVDLKVSNGTIRIVGSNPAWDMPDIVLWHPMVPMPIREND